MGEAGSDGPGLSVRPGEEDGESVFFIGLVRPDRLGTAKGVGEEQEIVLPSCPALEEDLDEIGAEIDGDSSLPSLLVLELPMPGTQAVAEVAEEEEDDNIDEDVARDDVGTTIAIDDEEEDDADAAATAAAALLSSLASAAEFM